MASSLVLVHDNVGGDYMPKQINVGMVGYKFMGKAHSNAWHSAPKFFDLAAEPVMKAICGRTERNVKEMADKWGWESYETSYKKLVAREDIDLIDITTPNNAHKDVAIAAAKAGKHVSCEKPLAMNVSEALEMVKVVKKAGVKHMIWQNYRRVPAIALAKQIIEEGRIGQVYHIRAVYLQDWIMDPNFPLAWRLRKGVAGTGAHGDLNAHIIDLARYLVGEFAEVVGMKETFVKERPLELEGGSLVAGKASKKKSRVTVDDATLFLARFVNGAVGTFEATRFANGRRNGQRLEINGSKGSLVFELERMNELQLFSSTDAEHLQGFKLINVTEACHPYMSAYWPVGHIIGWEHTFINGVTDFVNAIAKKKSVKPDFIDGLRNQEVLDAVVKSCSERKWIKVTKHKV